MDKSFNIKIIEPPQLDEALALVWRVFLAFEAPDYAEEGVWEFKRFIEPETIRQLLDEGQYRMWVCIEAGEIIGVSAMRPPCHISLLFVDAVHHRRGIARALVEEMIAQTPDAHDEMTVNASPYAVEIYHHLGFTDTDTAQESNGIRYTPMRRGLL